MPGGQHPIVDPIVPPDDDGLRLVRVLGPVDAVSTTGVIAIASRLERKLLAALALSARHAVPSSVLADILWGDDPPPSRSKTLHAYVSRLRQALGPGRVISEDSSYMLLVHKHELDALVFEELVAQAADVRQQPELCREACRSALSLWRGVAFGTFADEDPFRLEAIRLDEMRLFVVELQLESEIALGHHEMTVGSLQALAQEYPYRERIWELLVTALVRCGRRVEALRACGALRGVLGDVGLEPTPLIARLEEQAREAVDQAATRT